MLFQVISLGKIKKIVFERFLSQAKIDSPLISERFVVQEGTEQKMPQQIVVVTGASSGIGAGVSMSPCHTSRTCT